MHYKLNIFMMSLMIAVFMGALFNTTTENNEEPITGRFKLIESSPKTDQVDNTRFYVDTTTNLVYFSNGEFSGNGLSIYYNKNGKPMTYNEYVKHDTLDVEK